MARHPEKIVAAVDCDELFQHVESFGGWVARTSSDHKSGTDRVAEVARRISGVEIFIDVQGDEPEIQGEHIDLLVEILADNPSLSIATLAAPFVPKANESFVSVVCNQKKEALYFSRNPIPYFGDKEPTFLKHVGIYAFRHKFLQELGELNPSALEQAENLEQLRWLDNGYKIFVGTIDKPTQSIDTPRDYEAFCYRVKSGEVVE